MGAVFPLQPSKSPVTATPRALGAHTAKAVPADLAVERGVPLRMRAEHLPEPLVPSLPEQVQIDLAERRQEVVPVRLHHRAPAGIGGDDPVVPQLRVGHDPFEDAVITVRQWMIHAADARRDRLRVRPQHPDDRAFGMRVRPQHRVRIGVGTRRQQQEVAPIHRNERR